MADPRKSIGWSCVAALCVALGMGCSKSGTDDSSKLKAEIDSVRADLEKLKIEVRARPVVTTDREKASLAGRLAAAKALTSPSQKQEAVAKLAVDAAELGDAETAKGCIDQLASPSQKQEVIYRSALRLARANKVEDAVALANTLTSPSQKQQTLSKIANGDYRD